MTYFRKKKYIKDIWQGPKYAFVKYTVNPVVPNAPFFYPMKISENRIVFWCFQGVEKGCTGNKWVRIFQFDVINFIQSQPAITCSKLTIKTPEQRHSRHFGVFIVNSEHISHLVLVFMLLILNMYLPAGVTNRTKKLFDMINNSNYSEVKYFWCGKRCRTWTLIVSLERHEIMAYIETIKSRSQKHHL